MKLSPATENYIEAILILSKNTGCARSIDIAKLLNVSKPTVHKATHALKDQGLISQQPYGDISLTPAGEAAAKNVLIRHEEIKKFLINVLKVDEETAEIDACKMEHAVSLETMQKIIQFNK